MNNNSIEAKIVVLGSTGVGKTSIVVRYLGNSFNKHVSPTIGASFFTCKVAVDSYRVKLQVWDTAGQERFRSMAPMYYRKANAALIVFDLTSKDSFDDMKSWVFELRKNVETKVYMCVVANKSDLTSERAVSEETAREYAASINAMYFETSAVNNDGIEDVFLYVAKSLICAHENNGEMDHSASIGSALNLNATPGNTDQAAQRGRCC